MRYWYNNVSRYWDTEALVHWRCSYPNIQASQFDPRIKKVPQILHRIIWSLSSVFLCQTVNRTYLQVVDWFEESFRFVTSLNMIYMQLGTSQCHLLLLMMNVHAHLSHRLLCYANKPTACCWTTPVMTQYFCPPVVLGYHGRTEQLSETRLSAERVSTDWSEWVRLETSLWRLSFSYRKQRKRKTPNKTQESETNTFKYTFVMLLMH